MIKWAKLDEEDVVLEIIEDTDDTENEEPKLAFGTKIKPLNRDGMIRVLDDGPSGTYAAPGYKYDRELKKFVPPRLADEDELDLKTMQWRPPMPSDGKEYFWNVAMSQWQES